MQTIRKCHLVALLLTLVIGLPLQAQGDLELGKMWTFENPPLEHFKESYGFEATPEWLDAVRLASLRFGRGCSASFVSPRGLIMTNHHCARGDIAKISPPDKDWVRDGFFATSLAEEVQVPGLEVQQLISMQDVTEKVNEGITADMDDAAVTNRRNENRKAIENDAGSEHPDLRPQVVKLYHGGQFQLYLYKIYSDIRLAAAPNLQTAHFGGDPDNFTYPRYGIDFSFLRAYEDGKPLDTSRNYFRWSPDGAQDGMLVFVTGNPGSTGRLLTYAQLELLRDVEYPLQIASIKERIAMLEAQIEAHPEMEKQIRPQLLGQQNSRKALTGYLDGLLDEKLMQRKRDAETAFRARIAAAPALQAKYGSAFDRLETIAVERHALIPGSMFHNWGTSPLVERAVRLAVALDPEIDVPDSARTRSKEKARAMGTVTDEAATAAFAAFLERARAWLGKDDPYLSLLLAGHEPANALAALAASTKLSDDAWVAGLLDGGQQAFLATDDPGVRLGRVLGKLMVDGPRRSAALDGEAEAQTVLVGQALFAVYGTSVSPDATFTLRISDGLVEGYPCNGTLAPWRTSFYGLFGRNAEFENKYPFDLPEVWRKAEKRIDMSKSVDFVSTNDIIGGNSGSPVINADRQVVGLVFDGNIEMLPNRFLYSDDVARTVSVHSDAILEALRKVYNSPDLAKELLGGKGYN